MRLVSRCTVSAGTPSSSLHFPFPTFRRRTLSDPYSRSAKINLLYNIYNNSKIWNRFLLCCKNNFQQQFWQKFRRKKIELRIKSLRRYSWIPHSLNGSDLEFQRHWIENNPNKGKRNFNFLLLLSRGGKNPSIQFWEQWKVLKGQLDLFIIRGITNHW